ncbi:MAG: lipopolysaccharide heptosyltransferase II [Candidatus Omnitrophica bacterium]|nr:lipopolysaccharide heptosyltransferase II [Candidatus Omnitrophota bacterium]MCF7877987.1 lipopolysaccharide heptosyltransferase II [Candidatus Omnitrophota bacterium]
MNNPKKILIIRTDRLGDVILSTPVIKNIRRNYPQSHISFLCRPYAKDIIEGNSYLDEVIIYDKYRRHKSFLATLKFALSLRKKKFDLALVLHPTNRAHILAFFAGIPKRVGWDKKLSFLLTDKLAHTKDQGKKHELEYNLDLLRYLDILAEDKEIYIPVKEDAQQKVDQVLEKEGIAEKDKLIVIHPCASCPSKRWPQSKFIKLVKMLKEEKDIKIAVITSASQKEFGKGVAKIEGVIDLSGLFSIPETIALINRARLFISCDSGPVHIAAGLGKPVISIFGRSQAGLSPKRWAPTGKNSYFLHKNVGCQVCLAHNCQKGFRCLQAIKPTEVFVLAKKFV